MDIQFSAERISYFRINFPLSRVRQTFDCSRFQGRFSDFRFEVLISYISNLTNFPRPALVRLPNFELDNQLRYVQGISRLLYEFLILENFSFPDERRLNIKLIGFICFHLVSMMFRRFRERYPLSLRFERFKKKISSNVEYLLVIIVLSFREHSTLELMNKVFSRLRNLFIYERMVEHHPPRFFRIFNNEERKGN